MVRGMYPRSLFSRPRLIRLSVSIRFRDYFIKIINRFSCSARLQSRIYIYVVCLRSSANGQICWYLRNEKTVNGMTVTFFPTTNKDPRAKINGDDHAGHIFRQRGHYFTRRFSNVVWLQRIRRVRSRMIQTEN